MGAPEVPSWTHSLEAEQSLLGALMLNNAACDQVADLVSERDFYVGTHRQMFRAIFRLIEAGRLADVVSVAERMEAEDAQRFVEGGGFAYLAALAQNTPGAINVRRYAEVVHERAVMRKLFAAGQQIIESVSGFGGREVGELLDQAETAIMNISVRGTDETFRTLKAALGDAFAFVDEQYHKYQGKGAEVTGVPYGFIALDRMTSGMHPGQLIILGARPKMGKSAFALNVCEHAARATGRWALFFTLEMGVREQALRMLSGASRVNVQRLASGRIYDNEWPRVSDAVGKLVDLNIAFNEQASLTVTELRAQARRAMREYGGLSLIVVDYLQLMLAGETDSNRATQLAEISRGLKLLAKELQVPVLALSQLNRELEKRVNKRPVMSDLRDSGALEQDADVILFIYRDEVYHPKTEDRGIAEVLVAAQRNGPVGDIKLTFLGERTRFENYAAGEDPG